MLAKVAVITTHPIQYNAPLFRLLNEQEGVFIKVFYTWGDSVLNNKFDPGFGKAVKWDIPLLDGYEYEFVKNIAKHPGSHQHSGIDNPGLIKSIEAFDPTVLLVFGWNFKSHLKCIRYFKGKVPIFFRGDSTLLNERWGLKTILRRVYLRWVYRHIDYALYVGENNKKYFLKHGINAIQLIKAPHAVDTSRFMEPDDVYTNQALKWKAELGIMPQEITLLFAGKLEAVKNLSFLLLIADELKGHAIKIVIVGNGPLEKELKLKSKDNNQVVFLDFQNQSLMPVVYRLGDIFIMCSLSETWGLGANEAMACGCVLALSDKVGGAPDMVNESNGYIFSLSNPLSCVLFIKQLLNDRNKLTEMKKASKEMSLHFKFKNIVVAFVKKLTEIHKNNQ